MSTSTPSGGATGPIEEDIHLAFASPTTVTRTEAPTTIDDYLQAPAEPLGAVVQALRAQFDLGLPDTTTELWHGHPVWMDDDTPVAGFKAYPDFVTVLFWRGQAITDGSGKLNASGSAEMSEFKVRSIDDVDAGLFDGWLAQLSELDAA